MNRCPAHPIYFKTENTPCPGCRADFDEDIAVAEQMMPSQWTKTRLQQQAATIDRKDEEITRLHESLVVYVLVAVIGWVIIVIGGLSWVLADQMLAPLK